jgi:manganese/iron transport system ATP-binding protein
MEAIKQFPPATRPNLSPSILELTHVSAHFDHTPALDDVSFELHAGERIAVVGPNGAGKSTLFNIIAGVLKPSSGQMTIFGQPPGDQIAIAYVPQRNLVDWQFPINVFDVVMMGRIGQIGLFHRPAAKDRRIVEECLELVGMSQLARRQIGELSGGQQQRVFIARSLAQEAQLMLMDEPLTGLDARTQEDLFIILDLLQARGVTLLVATHDLNQAADRFDRVMLLNQNLIAFGPGREVLIPKALQQAYGGQMQLLETPEGVVAVPNL